MARGGIGHANPSVPLLRMCRRIVEVLQHTDVDELITLQGVGILLINGWLLLPLHTFGFARTYALLIYWGVPEWLWGALWLPLAAALLFSLGASIRWRLATTLAAFGYWGGMAFVYAYGSNLRSQLVPTAILMAGFAFWAITRVPKVKGG